MEEVNRQYRILVVDDDDDYRESTCLLLGSDSYMIEEARDSRSAKERLGGKPFHLCLLDSQMPNDDGETKDDTGLEIARWISKQYFYTSRIILTNFERVELVKRAIKERLVQGYYSKTDVARGNVASLPELVAGVLGERLVTLSTKNERPIKVDSIDYWDEIGVVERDLYESASGVVRFKRDSVMAHIHRAAGVPSIRAGARVVGRAVFGGEVEVLPAEQLGG